MTAQGRLSEWCRFLGARTSDEVASDLHRIIGRLDDVYGELSYVTKLLAGCPSAEAEEELRLSRTAVDEAIGMLSSAIQQLPYGDPDAA